MGKFNPEESRLYRQFRTGGLVLVICAVLIGMLGMSPIAQRLDASVFGMLALLCLFGGVMLILIGLGLFLLTILKGSKRL
ncbi:hypothetical protein JNK13_01860 [bacterium]|nr:hypothetical protein [bacterium]